MFRMMMILHLRNYNLQRTSRWFVSFIFFDRGSRGAESSTFAVIVDISLKRRFEGSEEDVTPTLIFDKSDGSSRNRWDVCERSSRHFLVSYICHHEEDAPREAMTWAPCTLHYRACVCTDKRRKSHKR